jgi:putative transposase
LLGSEGALTPLIKQIIEASLEGELETHFTESEEHSNNRRNGKSKKVVKSHIGTFELETPRDRNGTFEPQLVKKRQTILNAALDDKILALFCLGMSYDDISKHLQDMYGVEISKATMGSVTYRGEMGHSSSFFYL